MTDNEDDEGTITRRIPKQWERDDVWEATAAQAERERMTCMRCRETNSVCSNGEGHLLSR